MPPSQSEEYNGFTASLNAPELSTEDIREFISIWKDEFDELLSFDEARYEASHLVTLYAALAKPTPLERETGIPFATEKSSNPAAPLSIFP